MRRERDGLSLLAGTTETSGVPRHRKPQGGRRLLRWTAIVGVAAVMSSGAIAAVAAPGDSSASNARFLSGSLLTSGGALDALAALAGVSAANSGSTTPDTQTANLDLTALSAVNVTLPSGVTLPLGNFIHLGAVNQYAQASDAGVSRSGSGAVSNAGAVDLTGSGSFPADASIDLVSLLGPTANNGVLTTGSVNVGAVTGVAAKDATAGAPASTCADLSNPVNCRGYNVASAGLALASPKIGDLVASINGTLDTVSGTVNGLSSTLTNSVTGVVNTVLGALSGGQNDLAVTVSANLRSALSSVLSSSISNGGVTLDLANGTINVDLGAVIGGLNNQAPNTPLLSASVINSVVASLGTILSQLQTTLNTALSTALNAVPVTIGGGICMPVAGCNGPLGGKLTLTYNGTLGDLAAGTAAVTPTGTGAVPALLAPVLGLLTSTLSSTLATTVNPVITSAISTVGSAVTTDIQTLTTVLNPVLTAIGTVIGVNLNVQEAGATTGSYREVAVRVAVLGGSAATVDLGRAEVGANSLAAGVPVVTGIAPTHGPDTGGTAVTITGTGFTGATGVTFGGSAGTGFTVDSDTQITITTPAHAAGAVPVVVQSPAGDSAPGSFTFDPTTTVTGITPASGPEAGGTTVTITGSCFTGATSVTFAGTAATAVTVVNDTTITATTPAGTGIADVAVTGGGTCGTGTLPGAFTYIAPASITTIAPTHGPEAGGTVVTIIGTGFTGATSVTFDGTPGTGLAVDSDTQITVTTPAHAPGATPVVVATPNGDSAPGTFTFDPAVTAPTITGLAPNHGPVTGGTSVTITGTGFTGATGVTFDGTAGTVFNIVSDTQITVTTPPHAIGDVPVIVQSPNGASAPGTFTYNPVTTVTSVSPNSGPQAGGTDVLISGTCFTGATAVTFAGVGATFAALSDTLISAVVPAGVGVVDVSVTSAGDCGTGTLPNGYTYLPPAVATGLTPNTGPVTGGTVVTVTGTGFTGATSVTFDGTPGSAFVVDSDTQITVTTPAHPAGPALVTVVSPNGSSGPLPFTYVPVSSVLTLNPTHGPETGGTTVTITGAGLGAATGVTFDGIPGTNLVSVSPTELTVTTPVHVPGAAVVIAQSVAGDIGTGSFTFDPVAPVPTISGLNPDHGPAAGGTTVTITGTGLTGTSTVTFDGVAGTNVDVLSDTQLTVVTPAHNPGAVPVVVTTPGGASTPGQFTFDPATTIGSVDPGSGPETGGTTVVITGECFTGATGVLFGTTAATGFAVDSPTQITAVAPAGVGTVDVTVVGSDACGSATDPGAYQYIPAPVITAISPSHGPETGGTALTITGTGFTGATAVTLDGIPGGSFTIVSDTSITVTTPPHMPGTVSVVIDHPMGNSSPGNFLYDPVATVDQIAPNTGPESGGTQVTITGHCLLGAQGVSFGGVPAAEFHVVDDGTIVATTPPGVGVVDVVVTGSLACGDATVPGGFTYVPNGAPVIYNLTPTRGPVAGGTVVTITGTGFTGATESTFDGIAGTHFTVDSNTQITVTSPPHAVGTVDVVVVGADGIQGGGGGGVISGRIIVKMAASNAGLFTYYTQADVTGVDPGSGPESGGTTVTISGLCFTGATAVRFGSVDAKSFTVVNDTTITAVTPAGTGTVDVTVVGGGDCGTATLPKAFEYMTPIAALAATGSALSFGGLFAAILLVIGGAALAIRRRRIAE